MKEHISIYKHGRKVDEWTDEDWQELTDELNKEVNDELPL